LLAKDMMNNAATPDNSVLAVMCFIR
jgi:hypothetical protein